MRLKSDSTRVPAQLVLRDGRTFNGYSFGSVKGNSGEVVFNTGMTSYVESLTDPSYRGQILTSTYPLVGNYGVPSHEMDQYGLHKYFESARIQVRLLLYSFLTVSQAALWCRTCRTSTATTKLCAVSRTG